MKFTTCVRRYGLAVAFVALGSINLIGNPLILPSAQADDPNPMPNDCIQCTTIEPTCGEGLESCCVDGQWSCRAAACCPCEGNGGTGGTGGI